MSRFQAGDRVIANKSMVATVLLYDETVGRLTLEQDLGGGSVNTIYGPIQSYDLELIERDGQPVTAPTEPAAPAEVPAATEQGDEFTTLDTLQ